MDVHFGWRGRGIGLDRVHEHATALAARSDACGRRRPGDLGSLGVRACTYSWRADLGTKVHR